jgi:biopolymer transport protein ExbD
MQIRSGSALEATINVTPLVDICLVLLIIFMIVVPAMVSGIAVQLPAAKGAPVAHATEQTIITVKDDATVYIDDLVIRRDQFASEIQRIHAKDPKKLIAVRGDRRVVYGDLADVLDECREAGYGDVRLMTQKK